MKQATLRSIAEPFRARTKPTHDDRLVVEVLRNEGDLARLHNEWNMIAEKSHVEVYQTADWQRQWWRQHGRNRQLHMLAFRRHGVLVGIAPMFIDAPRILGMELTRRLCLLGTHPHEPAPAAFDVIALPDEEREVALAFSSYLFDHATEYSRVVLGSVSSSSVLFRAVLPLWEQLGWTFSAAHADVRTKVFLPDTLEQFLMEYDGEIRSRLVDSSRMVSHAHAYTLLTSTQEQEINESLSRLNGGSENLLAHALFHIGSNHTSLSSETVKTMARLGWMWNVQAEKQSVAVAGRTIATFKGKGSSLHTMTSEPLPLSRRAPDGAVFLLTVAELISRQCTVCTADIEDPMFRDHPARSIDVLHTITLSRQDRPIVYSGMSIAPPVRSISEPRLVLHDAANPPAVLKVIPSKIEEVGTEQKPRETTADDYSTSIVQEDSEFFALRTAWKALEDHSTSRVFQTFDWLWHWWKHFGTGFSLYILCVRKDGQLVALLPMFLERYTVYGRLVYTKLRLLGSGVPVSRIWGPPATLGVSDYLDLIVHPDHRTGAASAVVSFLHGHTADFDEIEWANVPEHGELDELIRQPLNLQGFAFRRSMAEVCPFVPVPGSVEEFIKGLDSTVRRRFSQARRLFKGHPAYTVESVHSKLLLGAAVDDLIHLHQRRWRRLGYPGLFADKRFELFLRDVVGAMYEKGQVWLSSVRLGGVRMAVRMGFTYRDRMYDYLSGFDDDLPGASKRPGYVLFLEMIEAAMHNGSSVIDMLRGPEAYKFELTSLSACNIHYRVWDTRRSLTMRRAVYSVIHVIIKMIQRCTAEIQLLRIHLEELGVWRFFPRYIGFRMHSIVSHFGSRSARTNASHVANERSTLDPKE